MEYLHVLSRPKVIDREHDTVWTEAYIDSTVSGHRSPISHMVQHFICHITLTTFKEMLAQSTITLITLTLNMPHES